MAADGTVPPRRAADRVPRYRVTAVERMTRIPASTLGSWERLRLAPADAGRARPAALLRPVMERAAAVLDPAGVVVSRTMPESLQRAVAWARDSRWWDRSAPAAWWGGPAVAHHPGLAAHLPGELLECGVDDGAETVDASIARRR